MISPKFKWIVLFLAFWLGFPQPSMRWERDILPLAQQWAAKTTTTHGGDNGPSGDGNDQQQQQRYQEQQPLRGVKVVITGPTSGIGAGLTLQLTKLGATVIAMGRSQDKLDQLKQQLIGRHADDDDDDSNKLLVPIRVQLDDLESVQQAAQEIQQRFDSIDVLINCAGTNYVVEGSSSKTTAQNLDVPFGVNYLSHFLLTEKMIPLLTKSNYHPTILQISSSFHWAVDGSELVVDGLDNDSNNNYHQNRMPLAAKPQGLKGFVFKAQRSYANTKLAQIMHARSLQRRHSAIRVVSICPGWVSTPIMTRPVQKFLLQPFAFPSNGFGIKSALHGLLDLQYPSSQSTSTTTTDDRNDFITNTGMSGVIHSLPQVLFAPLAYRLRIRDLVSSLFGMVMLQTQRFLPEIKAMRSSPESYNEQIQEALYQWSYETVQPFI